MTALLSACKTDELHFTEAKQIPLKNDKMNVPVFICIVIGQGKNQR